MSRGEIVTSDLRQAMRDRQNVSLFVGRFDHESAPSLSDKQRTLSFVVVRLTEPQANRHSSAKIRQTHVALASLFVGAASVSRHRLA
jgi:hypothetical protein